MLACLVPERGGKDAARCLVPERDGKDAANNPNPEELWDRYYTVAPERQ